MFNPIIRRLLMIAAPLALIAALHFVVSQSIPGTVERAAACNPCECPQDQRINCQGVEFYAVYTRVTTSGACFMEAWRMNPGGQPFRVWRVSSRTLASVPRFPEVNTLIRQEQGIALYRLTSGEYQVNAGPDGEGKIYVARFTNCPAENVQESSYLNRE
jgi:hypothetical protein